jgi:pimeloyl-ACP methyl ester carboxylesterase
VVEDRLMGDTWQRPGYDLLPTLRALRIPTIVIIGDRDCIPREIGEHIAVATPGARLVVLDDCGHFPYLECAPPARRVLDAFIAR